MVSHYILMIILVRFNVMPDPIGSCFRVSMLDGINILGGLWKGFSLLLKHFVYKYMRTLETDYLLLCLIPTASVFKSFLYMYLTSIYWMYIQLVTHNVRFCTYKPVRVM